jgi:hypothetical protein
VGNFAAFVALPISSFLENTTLECSVQNTDDTKGIFLEIGYRYRRTRPKWHLMNTGSTKDTLPNSAVKSLLIFDFVKYVVEFFRYS